MAWNSTYESRAGLFTLTFVSPSNNKLYDYTFNATISFSLERNLTDTLSKFSLDVIDDGTENFHGLENIVLSGITGIRVSYGVGTNNQITWSGFIYDYTSTFFGQKVKLTLIGYLTLCNNRLNDYAGHYYRLDWSPMVPYRNDYTRDWNLFQSADYVWQRDSDNAEITKISSETFLKTYEKAYSNALESDAKTLNDGPFVLDPIHDKNDLKNAIKKYLESDKTERPAVYYMSWIYDIKWVDNNGYIVSSERAYKDLQEAKKRYQLYETLYDSYFSRYKKGNFAVNFDITKLDNAVFSQFPSNFNSNRQILLPVPDIFIQWDGILPEAAYVDNKWVINNDSLIGTLNDVTAFGLDCDFIPNTVNNSDKNSKPTIILKGKKDCYGNVRILKMNNATYICVSDAKALAELRWGKMSGDADFTNAVSSSSTTTTTSKKDLSENAQQVYNYFKSYGYSDAACAAILGNMEAESGIVPQKLESHYDRNYTFEEACALVDEGQIEPLKSGWGLVQWTPCTKIRYNANGSNAIQRVSGDRNSISVQCEILRKGLEVDKDWIDADPKNPKNPNPNIPDYARLSLQQFKESNDVQATTRAFMLKFERPANQSEDNQKNRALRCSAYLNGIQGFTGNSSTVTIGSGDAKVNVPKTWYRSYYNYCLSAFRSALPLQYGGVYISEIVEKLCKIEGWTCDVTPTTWTSFESIQSELVMNGRNALDYIVNVLAPIATSENEGYTGYIVKLEGNHLTFKPAIPDRLGTLEIRMGYNISDSPVLSFSCKTRGRFIMYGIAEEVSTVTTYSNESSVIQTYTKSESFIESQYSSRSSTQGSNWFSKGLFSYYGFMNNLEGYNSFFTTFYSDKFKYGDHSVDNYHSFSYSINDYQGNIVDASINTSTLIRSTPYSSLAEDGAVVLNDLTKFERASIKAELTIIGDNRIIPNSYIEVINMTKRGRHYTSGIYWINKITDNFSKGEWTQKIECNRYDNGLDFFNRTSSTVSQVDNSISEMVDGVINKDISVSDIDKKLKEYIKG